MKTKYFSSAAKGANGNKRNRRIPGSLVSRIIPILVCGVLSGMTSAQAETSRGFIAPHEYALPGDLKDPLNIFVQYGYLDRGSQKFDAGGNKVSTNDTQTLVGLSKYVHLWNLEGHPNVGIGWEVIVPEIGVRDFTLNKSVSGLGDPIAGTFAWYKPTPNVTLGADLLLLQAPVGNSNVGGGDRWRGIQSLFWDVQLGSFNYTADLTWDHPSRNVSSGTRTGRTVSTEHRFAYKLNSWFEPYVGVDWERQFSSSINPKNGETALSVGAMFALGSRSHVAVHWSKAVSGTNRPVTNSLNARWVIFW